MAALIPGLTIVRKPFETYLIVRESDGDRELSPAECELLFSLACPDEATDDARKESRVAMIIHNGDHAEFEFEHSDAPPEQRPDWPLPSFDAKDWAQAFCKRFLIQHRDGYNTRPVDDDEGFMLAWFANALMRGFDEGSARAVVNRTSVARRLQAAGAEHGEDR